MSLLHGLTCLILGILFMTFFFFYSYGLLIAYGTGNMLTGSGSIWAVLTL